MTRSNIHMHRRTSPRLDSNSEDNRHLPVLSGLTVQTPCSKDWNRMTGDDQVRFCGDCKKNVYNLSSMTKVDAESLVREKEGSLCVRFYQRRDGTIVTADCPRPRRTLLQAVSAASAAAAIALSASACSDPVSNFLLPIVFGGEDGGSTGTENHPDDEEIIMMGEPMQIEELPAENENDDIVVPQDLGGEPSGK